MTKSRFVFSPVGPATSLRQGLLLGTLGALCAGAAPAGAAQTYVGNDFSPGSSLLSALETDGYKDQSAPLVILQEYNPSGPLAAGAIFATAGTVNSVSYYGGFSGGGKYDFTVYALELDRINVATNEATFTVVNDQTFSGSVSYQGVHNLSAIAGFTVGVGDYLAFAGIGPFYPQGPNDAFGSDATYESSPNTYTATPPTPGQTFTVGANGGSATYNYISDVHGNQGRSYGIGVNYTPVVVPPAYYLSKNSLGQMNVSWSNQSNWVDQTGAPTTSPPTLGSNVFINNRTGTNASGPTVVNFDATTDPKPNSLTIDSNNPFAGGQLVELSQSANTLTSGSELIGMTGPAEHLQLGGVNNVTSALTINGFGTYDLKGGTLNAASISVQAGGVFAFDGGSATFNNFTDSGSVVAGPATVLTSNCGCAQGNEVVAGAAGSYTPSTFTQLSGSTNQVGTLSVGNSGFAQGVYNLQGGQLLATNSESIGNGGGAKFTQSGSSNNTISSGSGALTVSGAAFRTVISGFSVSTPTTYELQGGSLSTAATGSETIGGSGGAGDFEQTGGTNTTGNLRINPNGTYTLSGGALFVGGDMDVNGQIQNSYYNIHQNGDFDMSGGTAVINDNLVNSGDVTVNGAGVTLVVDGNVNNSGALLLQNGGKIDPALTTSSAGTIGGTGTIVGPVKVTGGAVIADNLHIEGAYTQTGGTITFDVDPDGKGGFLESDLLFDPSDAVSITGTKIVFDFLDGANPLAFFKSGAFNLDAFFEESDGSLFSSDLNLESLFAGDTFATNTRGFGIAGFGADGGVELVGTSAVPEPSTWAMLIIGFGGLGYAGWRRGRGRWAAV